jgi:hypothetical protein
VWVPIKNRTPIITVEPAPAAQTDWTNTKPKQSAGGYLDNAAIVPVVTVGAAKIEFDSGDLVVSGAVGGFLNATSTPLLT